MEESTRKAVSEKRPVPFSDSEPVYSLKVQERKSLKENMFCTKCGKEIQPGNFCPYCGEKISSFAGSQDQKTAGNPTYQKVQPQISGSAAQQGSSAGVNQSGRNQTRERKKRHPLSKKGKTAAIILAGTAGLCAVGILGFTIFQNMNNNLDEYNILEADQDYVFMSDSVKAKNPFSSRTKTVDQDVIVHIDQTADAGGSEVWGYSEDLGWVCLSGNEYVFALPIQQLEIQPVETAQEITIDGTTNIFPFPDSTIEPSDYLDSGQNVNIKAVYTQKNGTLWGQINEEEWIQLKPDGSNTAVWAENESPAPEYLSAADLVYKNGNSLTINNIECSQIDADGIPLNIQSGTKAAWSVIKLISSQDIDINDLAQQLDAASGHTGSAKMMEVLNRYIQNCRFPKTYTAVSTDQLPLGSTDEADFEKRVKEDLNAGYPVVVFVNKADFIDCDTHSVYGLITGLDQQDGTNIYTVTLVDDYEVLEMAFSQKDLIQSMSPSGYFIYLY